MRAALVPAAGEWPRFERAQVDASEPSPSPHKFHLVKPEERRPKTMKGEKVDMCRVAVAEIERIAREEAEAGGITLAMIVGDSRMRSCTKPRQRAMWRCVRELGASVTAVGRYFGDRDHTTVVWAVHKLDAERHANPV